MAKYKRIPRQFSEQSTTKMILMVLHRLTMFVACTLAFTYLLGTDLSLIFKALGSLPLIFLGSCALHNIGLLGHEGTHFTLAKKHYDSALIGTLFSAMVPFHFNTGFAVTHALHHWHTNTEKDPDLEVFLPFKNFWSRFFLARSKASRVYLKDTILLAMGKLPHPNQVGLKDKELFKLAKINLFFSSLFLVIYGTLIFQYPTTFGLAFLLIYFTAVFLSGIRPYMEHVGTNSGDFSNSRTFSSPLLDYVYGTINYHLAHHMHPMVPAYNLPKLHQWMLKEGHIDPSKAVKSSSLKETLQQMNRGLYGPQH